MARTHAVATHTSLSKAVGDLLRCRVGGVGQPTHPLGKRLSGVHPLSGFPVSEESERKLTGAEIRRAMDDDLVRPLEIMGLAAEEIEEALR